MNLRIFPNNYQSQMFFKVTNDGRIEHLIAFLA